MILNTKKIMYIEFQQAKADSLSSVEVQVLQLNKFFDMFPNEGIWVSCAIGLLLYVIGWFGGTKLTLNKIASCIVITILVGIFSIPVAVLAYRWLLYSFGVIIAFSVVYIVWIAYLLGMAISLYETLIVTAEEGRPN